MEIALLNASSLSLLDLEFHRRALEKQMIEHFAPAWASAQWEAVGLSYRLPGGESPWPYAVYSDASELPVGAFFPLYYRDTVPDGELGDHDPMEAQVKAALDPADSTTPSHEGLETRGDPPADMWIPSGADGILLAAEAADAVEDGAYGITVDDVTGEPARTIMVSNFVLPSWFVRGSKGPWDFMHQLLGPQTITDGGYVIQDDNGTVKNIFGGEAGRRSFEAKMATPFSRAARRTSKLEAKGLSIDWVEHHRAKYTATHEG